MTSAAVLNEFLKYELNDKVRAQLHAAIDKLNGQKREFTYNSFNVIIDGAENTVCVEDEYDVSRFSIVSIRIFSDRLREPVKDF